MIIVGAKGFAKEILEVIQPSKKIENITFFDDINSNNQQLLFGKYKILNNEADVINYFNSQDCRFVLGLGNPVLRKQLYSRFTKLGGEVMSTVSSLATLSRHDVFIGKGTNILPGAIIANSVSVGIGCIIYYNSLLTHDVTLGDFVEVSPSATLLGRCFISHYSQIGANATILPDIRIGQNVVVAAGSVVTKDVYDNCMIAGVPAKIKRQIEPLNF